MHLRVPLEIWGTFYPEEYHQLKIKVIAKTWFEFFFKIFLLNFAEKLIP